MPALAADAVNRRQRRCGWIGWIFYGSHLLANEGRDRHEPNCTIEVRRYQLPAALQPFFTALYATTIECPPGTLVADCVHPEWGALRFTEGPPPMAAVGSGALVPQWPFVANGPTSQSIRFAVTSSRIWGLGLHPVGWSKFIDQPASELRDRTVDGSAHPAFNLFAPILDILREAAGNADAAANGIDAFLLQHRHRPVAKMSTIIACQEAIRDPSMANVTQLGARLAIGRRSLERLCANYFGFPPKLLLRRQRFLRSLAQFMLNPRGLWSKSLDSQYYDQAQFVHDFHAFMGMTPSEYSSAPHPILSQVIAHRMADQGATPRTDLPTILRYSTSASGQTD